MVIIGDSMYFYGAYWNDETMSNQITYGIFDIQNSIPKNQYPISNIQSFITDGTEKNIKIPYGIQVVVVPLCDRHGR